MAETRELVREAVGATGTMKAPRFHAAKDLRMEDIARPGAPGRGEVLVRNRFVGICGTDLHEYSYGPIFIPKEPHPFTGAHGTQVLGHEFGGVVEAVGEGVTAVKPGDRVDPAADHAALGRLLRRSRALPPVAAAGARRAVLGVGWHGGVRARL